MFLSTLSGALPAWLTRPRGLAELGAGAHVALPRRLRGKHRIWIGERSRLGANAWLEAVLGFEAQVFDPHIVIGRDVQIGRDLTLTACSRVEIGDGCLLGDGVYLSDCSHDVFGAEHTPLSRRPLKFEGEVHIGPRCYIGLRACVRPGVELGEGCVVGAHAIVTRSFPPGSVVAGAPARLLRTLPPGPQA